MISLRAPASGKTTIAQRLLDDGYCVMPEAATLIINEEINKGSSKQEISNNFIGTSKFQDRIYDKQLEQYELTNSLDELVFFDATIIDALAHRKLYKLNTDKVIQDIFSHRYDQVFFIEHAGGQQTRIIDPKKLAEAIQLDKLKKYAINFGDYSDVIEVPLMENLGRKNIGARIDFILEHIHIS